MSWIREVGATPRQNGSSRRAIGSAAVEHCGGYRDGQDLPSTGGPGAEMVLKELRPLASGNLPPETDMSEVDQRPEP